ncbi:hypothetical protein B0H13DRAFT_1883302 [Mycena leptocephala]|nr:hypothetical protein B0H13DRAFT_1883302 [Mycena leptocephala]
MDCQRSLILDAQRQVRNLTHRTGSGPRRRDTVYWGGVRFLCTGVNGVPNYEDGNWHRDGDAQDAVEEIENEESAALGRGMSTCRVKAQVKLDLNIFTNERFRIIREPTEAQHCTEAEVLGETLTQCAASKASIASGDNNDDVDAVNTAPSDGQQKVTGCRHGNTRPDFVFTRYRRAERKAHVSRCSATSPGAQLGAKRPKRANEDENTERDTYPSRRNQIMLPFSAPSWCQSRQMELSARISGLSHQPFRTPPVATIEDDEDELKDDTEEGWDCFLDDAPDNYESDVMVE